MCTIGTTLFPLTYQIFVIQAGPHSPFTVRVIGVDGMDWYQPRSKHILIHPPRTYTHARCVP